MEDDLPHRPPEDIQEIGAPEQFAALGHPLRQRLLFALGQRPATISQLAGQLDARKGNVAHHLKVLRDAGLVHVGETRQVRGGTEQYYRRTARHLVLNQPQQAGTAALFAAVAQELDRSPAKTHLTLRHLRLSPAKAQLLNERLTRRHLRLSPAKAQLLNERLTRLIEEIQEDPDGEPVHGVLVTLYQQADTGAT